MKADECGQHERTANIVRNRLPTYRHYCSTVRSFEVQRGLNIEGERRKRSLEDIAKVREQFGVASEPQSLKKPMQSGGLRIPLSSESSFSAVFVRLLKTVHIQLQVDQQSRVYSTWNAQTI